MPLFPDFSQNYQISTQELKSEQVSFYQLTRKGKNNKEGKNFLELVQVHLGLDLGKEGFTFFGAVRQWLIVTKKRSVELYNATVYKLEPSHHLSDSNSYP